MKQLLTLCFLVGILMTANSVEFKKLTEKEFDDMIAEQKTSEKKIAETIKKCKEDFESKTAGDRLRAILVISKYRQADVTPILIKALKDTDAPVRQAALVAFCERSTIPANAIEPIFNLFADKDIHIQRIATSTLPYLFSHRYLRNSQNQLQSAFNVTAAHKSLIHNCFVTADKTILKNILKHYTRLKPALSTEDLIASLKNKSPEVRVLALPACARILSPEAFISKVIPIMNQESSPTVIVEYLKQLRAFQRNRSIMIEKRWLKHKNSKISATALETAILLGNQDLEGAIASVLESDVSSDIKVRILWGIRNTRYANDKTIATLLKSDTALLQSEGIKLLAALDPQRKKLPQLLAFAKSEHSTVRQEAVKQITYYYRRSISKKQITALAENRQTDVKVASIQLLSLLDKDDREDYLLDYLVDGDDTLQAQALRSIIQVRADGWQDILGQSLKSSSSKVQQIAIQHIDSIKSIDQRIKFLTEYIKRKNNDPQLMQYSINKIKYLNMQKIRARSNK